MKAKRLCAMLVSAIALVIALVGTTGCTNLDQYKSNYVGTWELYSADFEGTSSDIDHDTYVLMSDAYDMHTTIDFDSDGNCLIDTFGTQYTGTWKVKDEKTVTLTIEGDSVDCPVDSDGRLTFSYENESMLFEKKDNTPDMDHSSSTYSGTGLGDTSSSDISSSYLSSSESEAYEDAYVDDVIEVSAKDVTVAQDEYVTIKVYAIGSDYEGDTGYLMTVYNNTDNDIYAASNDDFKVDDTTATGNLYRHVGSADTKKCFMYFSQSEVKITDTSACTGTISVYGADFSLLGTYSLNVQ